VGVEVEVMTDPWENEKDEGLTPLADT
jgi:hypothetical protein